MEIAILIAAVLFAGLTCPAMMWSQRHRGREAACCVPARREEGADLESLRARQRELEARIAAIGERDADPSSPHERRA